MCIALVSPCSLDMARIDLILIKVECYMNLSSQLDSIRIKRLIRCKPLDLQLKYYNKK